MLKNTFCHVSGISLNLERSLWESGVLNWDGFLGSGTPLLSATRIRTLAEQLRVSRYHLDKGEPAFFSSRLAAKEQWRLFCEFRESLAYLDIETTGLSRDADAITTIALYDGQNIRTFVQGENLEDFPAEVAPYRVLVTYNGKSFDIPFIERQFGISLPQAHIDLRYVLHSLGFRGGLKGCERQLGLSRGELDGVDGSFAVQLWSDYQRRGNRAALETLLAYNIEDVINLETLMVEAYNRKLAETPFGQSHALRLPARPQIPFMADAATISRLRGQGFGY